MVVVQTSECDAPGKMEGQKGDAVYCLHRDRHVAPNTGCSLTSMVWAQYSALIGPMGDAYW